MKPIFDESDFPMDALNWSRHESRAEGAAHFANAKLTSLGIDADTVTRMNLLKAELANVVHRRIKDLARIAELEYEKEKMRAGWNESAAQNIPLRTENQSMRQRLAALEGLK